MRAVNVCSSAVCVVGISIVPETLEGQTLIKFALVWIFNAYSIAWLEKFLKQCLKTPANYLVL